MENDIWKRALLMANATACVVGIPPAQHKGTSVAPAAFCHLWDDFIRFSFKKIFFLSCSLWREPWPPSRPFYHLWLPAAVPQTHNQRQSDRIRREDSYGKKAKLFFVFVFFFLQNSPIVPLEVAAKVFVVHFQSILSVVFKFRKLVPQTAWVKTAEQTKWLRVCCWDVSVAANSSSTAIRAKWIFFFFLTVKERFYWWLARVLFNGSTLAIHTRAKSNPIFFPPPREHRLHEYDFLPAKSAFPQTRVYCRGSGQKNKPFQLKDPVWRLNRRFRSTNDIVVSL